MSTIIMCPRCGGAIAAQGSSYYGRRCTCTKDSGGVATMTASDPANSTVGGHKFCCKCGGDVTHAKRMKDHVGSYWCYECGAADQLKKGQGVSMLCPECKKHFRPTRMVKMGEKYLCEGCHEKRRKRRGVLSRRSDQAGPPAVAKILVVLLVMAGLAVGVLYAMGIVSLP